VNRDVTLTMLSKHGQQTLRTATCAYKNMFIQKNVSIDSSCNM